LRGRYTTHIQRIHTYRIHTHIHISTARMGMTASRSHGCISASLHLSSLHASPTDLRLGVGLRIYYPFPFGKLREPFAAMRIEREIFPKDSPIPTFSIPHLPRSAAPFRFRMGLCLPLPLPSLPIPSLHLPCLDLPCLALSCPGPGPLHTHSSSVPLSHGPETRC